MSAWRLRGGARVFEELREQRNFAGPTVRRRTAKVLLSRATREKLSRLIKNSLQLDSKVTPISSRLRDLLRDMCVEDVVSEMRADCDRWHTRLVT
jgi:hypothetical protein